MALLLRPSRVRSLAVAVLALMLSACACAQKVDRRAQVESFLGRTVQIKVDCAGSDNDSWGTGVILGHHKGQRVIATAEHVAEEDCVMTVQGKRASIVQEDSDADVALLTIPGGFVPDLRPSEVWLGMPVTVVGYPVDPRVGGAVLNVSPGYLTTMAKDRYRTSAPSYYGNSGGPVFDEDGNLVGLFVSMMAVFDIPLDGNYHVTPALTVFRMYDDLVFD